MITVYSHDSLLETIGTSYPPDVDVSVIERAYQFSKKAHQEQFRITGEPYVVHAIATATKLAEMKLHPSIVAAGLLHDVPEDTAVTIEEIEQKFGSDIAGMVAGVTKLGKVQYRGLDRYVENLRKMFYAMAQDIRTVYIKFADRLHNMETLGVVPEAKQKRIAREVLEIYAPIANRLGMGEFKGQFEDLAFQFLYPDDERRIRQLRDEALKTRGGILDRMMEKIKLDLAEAHVPIVSIHGRVKHLYSLYQKLQRHENDIQRVYDLIAIRLIVPKVSDCYAALGIIHTHWKPLKGRIKDYIAQPKPNGYQSLHTTVFGENGMIVEAQIRTQEMHDFAEYGPAMHWKYKEGRDESKMHTRWIDELVKVQKELKNKQEFLENLEELKFDAFRDHIFVFTPKGDVIDLAEGSTPIDFAYAIHTEIGNKCMGARINDQIANLDTPLKSGDMCEVVIDKNRKGPSADWMRFVKTRHARSKIRDASRSSMRGWILSTFNKTRETRAAKKGKN